jgi:hypothetical protein
MNFLKWYKNTVESGKDEPPTHVWEDIQNDLDIDLVYERLEKTLAKDHRKVWIWRASSAAGILLFLSLGYLFINRENITPSRQSIAQKSTKNNFRIDTISEQPNTKTLSPDSTVNTTIIEKADTGLEADTVANNLMAQSSPELFEIKTSSSPDAIYLKTDTTEHPLVNIPVDFEDKQLTAMNFSLPEPQLISVPESPLAHFENPEIKRELPKTTNNKTNKIISKITISAHGEIANTWLINPKTKEAFDPQELTAIRPTFKQNYGFSIAGTLTERWEVIGKIGFAKQYGQHYQEYYQGKYVSNKIDLEYTDIAFKARFRPFRKDLNHAFSTGVYIGFLDNARQYIGSETNNITSDYTNADFGFIAGYQYFAPITNKITLAAGAFYRQGLKNVFAGNQMIGDNLNQSTNTSFNFTISLGYTFSL